MTEMNENFNEVLKLCDNDFSHAELINFLKGGSIVERQYSAIHLDEVKNDEEARILMSNLVGTDGKVREAVAFKIAELTEKTPNLFNNKKNFETLAKASIDIDGNVCRLAIISAKNLINNKEFSTYYADSMIFIIEKALDEISKFTFRDKKYKVNKQIFKIYWCLEALMSFFPFTEKDKIKKILTECCKLPEYTVREKCAEILTKMPDDAEFSVLKEKLEHDENYYVRNIFK